MVSVSVLMPVFNGEKYLGAAVESILAQTYPDFELVILDDGSTDGSLRMLRQFHRGDPRIRIISREHLGFDETANQLIGLAQGEYVALMAQDDIALPERLALKLANLREPVLRYRVHSSSISAQTQSQMRACARRACESAWRRRGIRREFEATADTRPGPD